MIHQHFLSISPLLNQLLAICSSDHDPYFDTQYSADETTVTDIILQSEYLLFDTLEKLSILSDEKHILEHIKTLTPECRFLLYVSIQISYLHFHADVEMLPMIPPTNLYPLLFAYLQEAYCSFRTYCQQHNLSIWNEILEYEISIL